MIKGVLVSIIVVVLSFSISAIDVSFLENHISTIGTDGKVYTWTGKQHECNSNADCVIKDKDDLKAKCQTLSCNSKLQTTTLLNGEVTLHKPIRTCQEITTCQKHQECASRFNLETNNKFKGKCCPKNCVGKGYTKLKMVNGVCACANFRCDITFSGDYHDQHQRIDAFHVWTEILQKDGHSRRGNGIGWFTFFNIQPGEEINIKTEIKDGLKIKQRTRDPIVAFYPGPAKEMLYPEITLENKIKAILHDDTFEVTKNCRLKKLKQ